ncbi:MAG: hypothetical protein DLM71_07265 [Chloroflexi bacterium]|nr:MAG: hypothetical protein DLM71_07265 [Chloroflexota bacterium]
MRIYEGSPRQDWEEVLRSIGAFADRQRIKEILFLEINGGFLLQGLGVPGGGGWSESVPLSKQTHEITDEQVGQLMDERTDERRSSEEEHPHAGIQNYYEQALRVLGGYVDGRKPRDLFFFEQQGSFVLRMLTVSSNGAIAHELAEFTREEILAMIENAPDQRRGR